MRLGRFLFGFCLIWGALYASGAAQGGGVAYGLLALAIIVAVAALWEHLAFATPARALLVSLGFGRPTGRSLLAGAVLSAAVLFSISLAMVSIFVPLGVLVVGNRFFGRKPSPGRPAESSRTHQPLVLWRQTWT